MFVNKLTRNRLWTLFICKEKTNFDYSKISKTLLFFSNTLNLVQQLRLSTQGVMKGTFESSKLKVRRKRHVIQRAQDSLSVRSANQKRTAAFGEPARNNGYSLHNSTMIFGNSLNYRDWASQIRERLHRNGLQNPPPNIPNLNAITGAAGNHCGMNWTPTGAVNASDSTGQFHNWLKDALHPNANVPVTATGEEYLWTPRRIGDAGDTAVVHLQHCGMMLSVVYGTFVDTTLIRSHKVVALFHRMHRYAERLWMSVSFHDLLALGDGQAFHNALYAVQPQQLITPEIRSACKTKLHDAAVLGDGQNLPQEVICCVIQPQDLPDRLESWTAELMTTFGDKLLWIIVADVSHFEFAVAETDRQELGIRFGEGDCCHGRIIPVDALWIHGILKGRQFIISGNYLLKKKNLCSL